MNRCAKKPLWTEGRIQRNHRRRTCRHIQKIEQRFHEVVRLHRATRDANNRNPGLRLPLPSQVIRKPHASRRIALHGVNATISRASSRSHDCPTARCEPIDPITSCYRLPRLGIGSKRGPVAFLFIVFVRDGAFDHQNERRQFSVGRTPKKRTKSSPFSIARNGLWK